MNKHKLCKYEKIQSNVCTYWLLVSVEKVLMVRILNCATVQNGARANRTRPNKMPKVLTPNKIS